MFENNLPFKKRCFKVISHLRTDFFIGDVLSDKVLSTHVILINEEIHIVDVWQCL